MVDVGMKQKIQLGCKFALMAVSLGLPCAVSLGGRTQASTQPVPAVASAPSAQLQPNPQPAATDELTVENPAEIRQLQPSQLPASDWQGSSFPVENLQAYSSAFGYRESPTGGYTQEFHYGLDMAAPEGSYVHNWWTGTVKQVSDDTNCGTSVVVQSGDWTATYCHMQGYTDSDDQGRYNIDREIGLQIREGQLLPAGARMGRVGMTGRTTGPHLHWTLKYAGNYVDPGYVLRAMYQGQQAQKTP
jgi:murein DD-endopeptidase MepM/ murein hydrolase activator NlpD